MPTDPTSAPGRPHRQLSAALALLHRTLLQAEAEAASLTGNPYALLGAVMHDPRFAWLKPMTQLMVSLDEMGAKGANPPIAALVPHLETTDRLLDGPPGADGFRERLDHWRQHAPAVAEPEAALRGTLRTLRAAAAH